MAFVAKRLAGCVALAISILITGGLRASDEGELTTGKALLQKAEESVQWSATSRIRSKLTTKTTYDEPRSELDFDAEVLCERQGPGRFHEHRQIHMARENGKPIEIGGATFPYFIDIVVGTDQYVQYMSLVPRVAVAYDPHYIAEVRKAVQSSTWVSAFLDGWISDSDVGPTSIFDLARERDSSVALESQRVDDVPCRVVEAQTDAGVLRVWIAPSRGYAVLKYTMRQDKPGKTMQQCEIVCDGIKLREMNAKTVIIGGHFRARCVPISQHGWLTDCTSERLDIELSPTFAADTFLPTRVPENAKAIRMDEPGSPILNVWRHGKAVPAIDEELLKEIDRDSGKPQGEPEQ